MKTTVATPEAPAWYVVDATGERLGRLATRIAYVLNGKHKVTQNPHTLQSDHVIVLNAEKLVLEGKKALQKVYVRHSGYLGHVKKTPFAKLFAKTPEKVLEIAVRGMLARNKLRAKKMAYLHVNAGATHPHEAQQPRPLTSISLPLRKP